MRSGVAAAVVILLVVVGAVAGYALGVANQPTSTITTTSFATAQNSCTPQSDWASVPIPLGFLVTVSYSGSWSLSIASFASKVAEASAYSGACGYEGSGTITFYVGLANYSGGWNSLVVLAHKFGSNGTLMVSANIGDETESNSTAQSYGSVITTISFDFD
jgi:hypothetical protein